MKTNRTYPLLVILAVACFCLAAPMWITASVYPPSPYQGAGGLPVAQQESDQDAPAPKNNSNLARQWFDRIRGIHPPGPHERNHQHVKDAFTEVVAPASRSTVHILSGGKAKALGTIVDPDGYVLTKASELGDDLVCLLNDGRKLSAKIVGVHVEHDLAMLKIEAANLTPISWSGGAAPPLGSWLATPDIDGKPLAIGVVSVAPRRIATPSGVLGIEIGESDPGPKIQQVLKGSGAQKAGLRAGDIVISAAGIQTPSRRILVETIRRHKPGDRVKLRVKRGDQQLDVTATLGGHFPGMSGGHAEFQDHLGGPLSDRRAGFPLVMQHDTVLRPSDCGGPLVDLDGRAVGINIARAGRVASYAVPASVIKPLLADLKSGKLAPPSQPAEPSKSP